MTMVASMINSAEKSNQKNTGLAILVDILIFLTARYTIILIIISIITMQPSEKSFGISQCFYNFPVLLQFVYSLLVVNSLTCLTVRYKYYTHLNSCAVWDSLCDHRILILGFKLKNKPLCLIKRITTD